MAEKNNAGKYGGSRIQMIPTGVPGLDTILGGGLPLQSTILLSGPAGSGKTILSMQFLYDGIKKLKEAGVYLTFEQSSEKVIQDLSVFSWDLRSAIANNMLTIMPIEIYRFDSLLSAIENSVEKHGAKRIVVDSSTVFGYFFENLYQTRRGLLELDKLIKKLKCTAILTNELEEGKPGISSFGIEEFTADGIILMDYAKTGSRYVRTITVRKMRGVKHSNKVHQCEITDDGVIVHPNR